MSDDDISMVRGAPQLPLAPSPGISDYREKAGSRSERRSWNNWPPLGGAPARMRPAHIHFHTRRLKPSPWESGSHATPRWREPDSNHRSRSCERLFWASPIGVGGTTDGATYRFRSETAMLAWIGCPQPLPSRRDREFESVGSQRRTRFRSNLHDGKLRAPFHSPTASGSSHLGHYRRVSSERRETS